ncbi:MAG: hypothetical protein CM15mP109_04110 [Candidatus Dadabacteria bacterium]|nr:MAG: hypothetical protein CM15mP109_04110 [Candidatus Dadabacteria bacterium]
MFSLTMLVLSSIKPYDKTTLEEWDRVLDTDLKGPWLMCKYIVPGMVDAGSGSVINISSLNGLVGFPLSTALWKCKRRPSSFYS